MKKKPLLLFLPLILIGCNNESVKRASNPFNDTYTPIGMKGEYSNEISAISSDDFNLLKKNIADFKSNPKSYDKLVSSYKKEENSRDLKYSYFSKELNPTDMCSYVNDISTNTKYKNHVSISDIKSDRRNQYNGGIGTILSNTIDYTYDPKYKESELGTTYKINTYKQINKDDPVITSVEGGTIVEDETFNVSPYASIINSHFNPHVIRKKPYAFEILGDNNDAIYGSIKYNNQDYYLVKEAKSVFDPYTTALGREYKAVDNFFYEGLFKKYTYEKTEYIVLTNFRFYHEMLILSEACDSDVPVLYLENPVLVEYNEFKYSIEYNELIKYTDDIPQPVKPE